MKNVLGISYVSLPIVFTVFLSSCSALVPMNKPATSVVQPTHLNSQERSNELAVILTFSGGGMRAAALSYGVMKALRDTPIRISGKQKRLLDEVDIISSVSGGSFTSAYYGLYGDQIFKDYEKRFLKRNIQTTLIKLWLLNPRNWGKVIDPYFNRGDLAAEYYDKLVFEKKTFADIRPDSPEIVINATDLSLGRGITFNQYFFNSICSDLSSFPVGRAVAASSAVPVLFTPITIENFSGRCANTLADQQQNNLALDSYSQAGKYRYLHLVDGGITDNLGIRSLLEVVNNQNNNMWHVLKTHKMENARKIIFIVVNAENYEFDEIAKNKISPKYAEVASIVSSIQFHRTNTETLDELKGRFPEWEEQIKQGRCKEADSSNCSHVEFYLAEVNLKGLSETEKKNLQHVPTTLKLSKDKVDMLIESGQKLLKRSPEFKRLLNELN